MPARSGGFRASSFRSSSFRASTPKPSVTPAPSLKVEPKATPAPTKNVTINKTYVQKDYHGGSSDGPGFFTGLFMGHLMSDNDSPAPVIVNNPGTTAAGTVAPAYIPQEEEGMGFLGWSAVLLILGLICWFFIKKA